MRIEHDVRPVTYMKTKAAELLRSVEESRRPVIITQSGEPNGSSGLCAHGWPRDDTTEGAVGQIGPAVSSRALAEPPPIW